MFQDTLERFTSHNNGKCFQSHDYIFVYTFCASLLLNSVGDLVLLKNTLFFAKFLTTSSSESESKEANEARKLHLFSIKSAHALYCCTSIVKMVSIKNIMSPSNKTDKKFRKKVNRLSNRWWGGKQQVQGKQKSWKRNSPHKPFMCGDSTRFL